MKYAIAHKDGEIIQEGHCPANLCTKQSKKGYFGVPVANDVTALTHRIIDGKAVKKTPEEIAAKQAQLKALDEVKPGLTKIEHILVHLKKSGVDLGPHGAHL